MSDEKRTREPHDRLTRICDAGDERRAEIEAVARTLNSHIRLGWSEGLAEAIVEALDRLRDARGDDEGQQAIICDRCGQRLPFDITIEHYCRSPQDEGQALRAAAKRVLEADMRGVRDLDALNALEDAAGFSQQGQDGRRAARSPQDEGHEAGIEAVMRRVAPGFRQHDHVHREFAESIIAAYKHAASRVSPSRDGTVALDPPLSEREREAIEAMRAAVKIVGDGEEPVPYDIRGMAAEVVRLRAEVERLTRLAGP